MINRKYFFSSKVAHNDSSGNYSWCYSVVSLKGWFQDDNEVLESIKSYSWDQLNSRVKREFTLDDIEIISCSRIN